MLKQISLTNFRSHASFPLELNSHLTLIIGANASGKTSLIEAINLLSSAESFRAGKIEEMIKFGNEIGRVKGLMENNDEKMELEILINNGLVQNKRTQKRIMSVNGIRRRSREFIGKLTCVTFRPEDMRLIEGSPGRRRRFLDSPNLLLSHDYATSLKTYDQSLLRKNRLLPKIRDGEMSSSVLTFWNNSLLKHGQYLQQKRLEFLNTFKTVDFPLTYKIEYLPSVISEERQKQYLSREIAAGHTLIGPHKDDFIIHLIDQKHQDLQIDLFGSRGQQRLAVLWLKFCELNFLLDQKNEAPILLLDDILSELDNDSQHLVLKVMKKFQTVITTTHTQTESLLKKEFREMKVVRL